MASLGAKNDLPPVLRYSRKNMVLAALYVGYGHPNWDELVPRIRGEILSSMKIISKSGRIPHVTRTIS